MNYRSIFSHYWIFVKQYKFAHIVIFVTYAIGKITDIVLLNLAYKRIIDIIASPPDHLERALIEAVLAVVVFMFTLNFFFRIGDYWVVKTQSKILEQLSNYSLEKIQQHSYGYFTNTFAGSLIAKSKRFVKAFETLHDQLIFSLWFGIISLISSVVVLFYFSKLLGAVFLGWLFFYLILVRAMVIWQTPKSLENARSDSHVTAVMSDIITNFFTVKMFGSDLMEQKYFEEATLKQEKKRREAWMQQSFWNGIYQGFSIMLFVVLMISFSVWLWYIGEISAGTIVLVQIYLVTSFNIVWQMSKNVIRVSAALTDADEMVEVFDQEVEVNDLPKTEKVKISKGEIVFSDVVFSYENNSTVFKKLNLNIEAGQHVALVGHSGAGKTTITKLLLRFSDVDSGKVLIDGQDISKISQNSLRHHIAYVPQEPLLFHRTISENIAYGKPGASEAEIKEVARRSFADEFIETLPKGYDTLVGERGVKLSGGERQRIAIARAMLKDAPIVILDEATSALDSVSEQKIQDACRELMEGRTTIVIAHRLSTIKQMDRIIVFDNGKIVEDGTHADLVSRKGTYAELWNSQVGGFITE